MVDLWSGIRSQAKRESSFIATSGSSIGWLDDYAIIVVDMEGSGNDLSSSTA